MKKFEWIWIVSLIGFTACSRQAGTDVHDEAETADAATAPLSDQALRALDLETVALAPTNFVSFQTVRAVAELHPLGRRPITTPMGGRVVNIHAGIGQAVDAQVPLFEVLRDALPMVELTMTEDLLKPGSEDLHETAAALRRSVVELDIAQSELKRLNAVNVNRDAGPVVPRQRIVELEYEVARAQKDVTVLEGRLNLHGYTDTELKEVVKGGALPVQRNKWKAALTANGLWEQDAQFLWEVLPKAEQENAWTIAAVGELSLRHLVSEELINWMKTEPELAPVLPQIAGLMQQGVGVETLKQLHRDGAFAERMQIRAPEAVTGWELETINVQWDERVSAGQKLGSLVNYQTMYLKAFPVGNEIPMLHAIAADPEARLRAVPLVKQAGPSFEGLRLERMRADTQTLAWFPVTNQVQVQKAGVKNWALLPGTPYEIQIPTGEWNGAWVLPVDSIAEQGADTVVFVQNGDDYAPVKVTVRYRDDRVVVLDRRAELFPGDRVVTQNAFGLALALASRGGQVIDPHAGHNH